MVAWVEGGEEGSIDFPVVLSLRQTRRHHSIFFGNLLDQFSIETDRLSKFIKR